MSTHGVLSESSVSAPVVTHDRKGREGKGREERHHPYVSNGGATRLAARMDERLTARFGGQR